MILFGRIIGIIGFAWCLLSLKFLSSAGGWLSLHFVRSAGVLHFMRIENQC